MVKAKATTQREVDAREAAEARERVREEAMRRLAEIDRESVRSLREAIIALHEDRVAEGSVARLVEKEAEAEAERERIRDEERRSD